MSHPGTASNGIHQFNGLCRIWMIPLFWYQSFVVRCAGMCWGTWDSTLGLGCSLFVADILSFLQCSCRPRFLLEYWDTW
jgi:hypothetical protein